VNGERLRRGLFVCGVAALALSVALAVGSALEPVRAEGYRREVQASRPWVYWGSLCALAGLLLSLFGYGRRRLFTVAAGFLVLAWWYGAGMALGR